MKNIELQPVKNFSLELDIKASDKSLSHRSAMLALFTDGTSRVKNFLEAEDTLCSLEIAKELGLIVSKDKKDLLLKAPSEVLSKGLKTPSKTLDCGNSGTSIRLYTGLIAGANINATLDGDKYLRARPMKRVIEPLTEIGAKIESSDFKAPLKLIPQGKLEGFHYKSKISSAQVKSALILAGLQADKDSTFKEPYLSRDHTENMLLAFQKEKNIELKHDKIYINPLTKPLDAFDIEIANDPSSAFFFAVAALLIPDSKVVLKNVLLNKTRIEAYKVLESMGADIKYENIKEGYEKSGDIVVTYSPLKAVSVTENISWLIDEIPALSLAMAVANGTSEIRNAKELRVKESDRIKATIAGLHAFGIETVEYESGFDIIGSALKKGEANSFGDHRIAMSFIIASLASGGKVTDCECINTSFPNFFDNLELILRSEHALEHEAKRR
ncbi:3-phosphoshikimate 1-carboxyvinyltransferase [Helicobacter sp. 13S00401-1]|uniref:3-phosphoshikimate 1-carboxyvinyltransferase n=1 Tax=Helicobacter sp. 13S00401-1 TaxID=1905758 RepID=UPI000BA547E2|nr:3-phosphoshikimate 1-carboxyvinyltransferase [Helicobacter sp. 13S00401-1]PAF51668.1 3-phosphoshikimate 1-carboxyvinyltransferase [Helicobacter sp. 13S00401-1]